MNTLYSAGNRIPYTNSGSAIAVSAVVVLVSGATGLIGIAVTAIAASTGTGELCIGGYPEGVHTLAKHTGEAFTVGQLVYWDASNNWLTATATGNTRAGRIIAAAASAATTAKIKINVP